jgi:hypothetical protein
MELYVPYPNRNVNKDSIIMCTNTDAHAIKFQSIMFPDEIIVFLDGAYTGNRHDSGILRDSNVGEILESSPRGTDRRQLCIYGGSGYPNTQSIMCPFKRSDRTAEEEAFNTRMASLRISVEWGFGKIVALFPFIDFKKN